MENPSPDVKKLFIDCACSHKAHLIVFQYDPEHEDFDVSYQMNHYLPWYKRVLVGLSFAFGYNKHKDHWDGSMFHHEDVVKLRDLCQDAVDNKRRLDVDRITKTTVPGTQKSEKGGNIFGISLPSYAIQNPSQQTITVDIHSIKI